MSVREYVGARYVPLFADPITWDNVRTYEPLTIVQYQGDSYTSRRAVPPGIDILNEDYWVCTGNFSEQIEQYRSEVYTYSNRINQNAAAISAEETRAKAAEEALDNSIGEEAESRQNAVDALESDIEAETTARQNAIGAEAAARQSAISEETTARESAIAEVLEQVRKNAWLDEMRELRSISFGRNWCSYPIIPTNGAVTSGANLARIDINHDSYTAIILGSINIGDSQIPAATPFATIKNGPGAGDVCGFGANRTVQNVIQYTGTDGKNHLRAVNFHPDGTLTHAYILAAKAETAMMSTQRATEFGGYFDPFTYCTRQQALQAAQWVVSRENGFKYSDNVGERLGIGTDEEWTDCSGLIFRAFKAQGARIPNYATSQARFGKMVTFAYPGDDLDVSALKVGDIVCYSKNNFKSYHHVGIVTTVSANGAIVYDQAGPNRGDIGPESRDAATYKNAESRFVVRYWDDADAYI